MTDNNEVSAVTPADLNANISDLANKIVAEQDLDTTKDLVKLFNLNLNKKEALRMLTYDSLFDSIMNQMTSRFEKRPDEFSNEELLKYMTSVQSLMDKSQKALTGVDDAPPIRIQQNTQINVNVIDTLDRDSRNRVTDTVKAILQKMQQENTDIIEAEVIDNTNEEERGVSNELSR